MVGSPLSDEGRLKRNDDINDDINDDAAHKGGGGASVAAHREHAELARGGGDVRGGPAAAGEVGAHLDAEEEEQRRGDGDP